MFKTGALAASMAALLSTSCLAAAVVTPGQYSSVTQYTGLIDPNGICAGLTPVGDVTSGEATVKGLGKPFVQTIANPATASPYSVGYIQCSYPSLPAAGAFTATSNGGYTNAPKTPQVTTCSASTGITYTLTSSNNSMATPPSSLTINVLPVNGTLSSFQQTAGYSTVAVGGTTVCYLSTDSLFSRTGK